MRAIRTGAALLAATALLLGCTGELPRLDRERRRMHETRPGVVRISSYATATFSWTAADIERAAAALSTPSAGVVFRRPAAPGEVETGTGGSASGFIVRPDGLVVTDADAPRVPRTPAAVEAELRRNGAKAALARHVEAAVLDAAILDGSAARGIERLALDGVLERTAVVDRVELANGTSLPYRTEAVSDDLAAGSGRLALLRIDRRNLPSLELATGAKAPSGTKLWVVGYPAVATRSADALGGWSPQDAELDAAFNPGEIVEPVAGRSRPALVETNAAVYEGNAGGPVVGRADGRVLGVALRGGGDRGKVVVAADAVAVLLGTRGVEGAGRGRFQETYAAALDAAEKGDWASARRKLEEADSLFPSFPDLVRLRAEAEAHERESTRLSRLAVPVATFALLACAAVVAYALLRRGAKRKPVVALPDVTSEVEAHPRGRAPGTRGPSLGSFLVASGARRGERILLSGPVLVIGREARNCDVVFEHPKVSRIHAEISEELGAVSLFDRGSVNGTWVNGEKIQKRILQDGDIIYFGGANAVIVAFRG